MTAAEVHVVLPGDVDDPDNPSGGNRYDRRVCDGLRARRDVHEIAVAGAWPRAGAAARRILGDALTRLPDDAPVLLDGLVAGGVPELLEAHAARLRLVVLVHLPLGDETGLPAGEAADLTALERRGLHAATSVIATSTAAARRLTGLYDLPDGSVHVALPGVDPAPLTEPWGDGGRLLCVAAVTPRKGQDVLVDALERLGDRRWSCVFAGAMDRAATFAADVRARAARLPDVRFAGIRTGAALDATYADADLLVLPSRAETYGMVVTEALARGIPVLVSDVAGVPEALGAAPDGTTPGRLLPPGDPAALAAALRDWLDDPALRDRWRAAARARRAGLPGWDVTTDEVSEVLDR